MTWLSAMFLMIVGLLLTANTEYHWWTRSPDPSAITLFVGAMVLFSLHNGRKNG